MKHLKEVNENYFKHFLEALLIVFVLFAAGLLCLIHSVFPFIFTNTSSNMIKNILKRTESRKLINE